MKRLFQLLFVLFALSFLVAAFVTTQELFSLKNNLYRLLDISATQYEELKPYLQRINIFLGVSYGSGLLFFLFYILQEQKKTSLKRNDQELMSQEEAAQKRTQKEQKQQSTREAKIKVVLDQVMAAMGLCADASERLGNLCKFLEASQGVQFTYDEAQKNYAFQEGYAFVQTDRQLNFEPKDGLVGHVAATGKALFLDDIPEHYVQVKSGLGEAKPAHMVLLPYGQTASGLPQEVYEIATFKALSEHRKAALERWLAQAEAVAKQEAS